MFKKLPYLCLSVFMLMADQLSKWAVTEHMIRPALGYEGAGETFLSWLTTGLPKGTLLLPYAELPFLPFFNIVMVWNKGVSFGLFNNAGDYGPFILIVFSSLVTLCFVVWLFLTQSRLQSLGMALVIGGAVGNTLDRLRFSAVIDFLDFHVFGWHYPAFNIADSAIVIGVFMLMAYVLFFEKRLSPDDASL